jgi:arylsulfatase A-like enzyme
MKTLKQYVLSNIDKKLFCFVNLMQTHEKYNPPKQTKNRFVKENKEYNDFHFSHDVRDYYAIKPFSDDLLNYFRLRYEEEILHLDNVISDFIEYLKGAGLYDSSLLIITSDHGEHFGENGCFAHHFSIHDPVIRIPMYIKWPGKSENNSRVESDLVMLQDIYSTFSNLLDHWQPCPDSSIDLTSSNNRPFVLSQLPDMTYAVEGCRKKRNDFSLAELGLKDGSLNAYVFDDGTKIIENDIDLVQYNLNEDPTEENPVRIKQDILKTIISAIED